MCERYGVEMVYQRRLVGGLASGVLRGPLPTFGGISALLCYLVLAILLWGTIVEGQVDISGMLDVAYKQDIGRGEGEGNSEINSSIKGASPFNLVRARFFVDSEIGEGIAVATTLLYDQGLGHVEVEGGYVIFEGLGRWEGGNAKVGKFATPFGSFAARSFGLVNPLVGLPLIYHYFSAVQGNRVPADNAEQLGFRDVGHYRGRGLPTMYDACWNSGIEVFGPAGKVEYAIALTKGALSNPDAIDNDGVQFVGRVGAEPTMGLRLGFSLAYGPYLQAGAGRGANFPAGKSVEDFNQFIYGVDFEYSRGHLQIFAEGVRNSWEVPNLQQDSLGNTGGYIEGKYAILPGFYCSARYGQIIYDEIDDGVGGEASWDYDVRRVESGLGYYFHRNVHAKAVVQLNFWDGAADEDDHMVGAQLASFF